VNREKEMKKYNPIYYKIYIKLSVKIKKKQVPIEICLDDEFQNLNIVQNIVEKIKRMRYLEINDLIREKRVKQPPLGLNTATMLKYASSKLGYSPKDTMSIAQNLYMKGYITYPRTETNVYSSSFNFKSNLKKFSKDNVKIKRLIKNLKYLDLTSEEGIDAGDHPPITPSRNPTEEKLNQRESDLFHFISNYYFSSISPNLEYQNIKYEFYIGNKTYKSTCSYITKKGFLNFFDSQDKKFLNKKTILERDIAYKIVDARYEENKKDNYITEAELIEEMEKNHIGTDASMSVHIANIVNRGYVKVDNNRRLIPTKLGKALIEALEAVEPDIVLPKNRATIEAFVSDLANGKKTYEEVLNYSLKFYKEKYINVSEKIDELFDVFGKYFKLVED
jgi:DNA topoisomerase-3